MTKLSEIGELGLLAELERRRLIVGVENDATVLGEIVVTQDALVEGVHFLLDRLTWRELGFRAAAVNISDLGRAPRQPRAPAGDRDRRRDRALRGNRRSRGAGRRRRHDGGSRRLYQRDRARSE